MVTESVSYHFLLAFVSLIKRSATAKIAMKIVRAVWRAAWESKTAYIISRFFAAIKRAVQESGLYAWLGNGVCTEKKYSESLFYNALNAFVRWALQIVGSVWAWGQKLFGGSYTACVCAKITSVLTLSNALALFVGFLMICPHDFWNNMYTALAAAFFVAWAAVDCVKRGKFPRAEGINLSLIIFFAAIVISVVTAIVFSDALRISILLLAAIFIALAIYLAVDDEEKLIGFLKIVLTFLAITALYAIVQRIMGVEVDEEFVDLTENEGMPGRVYSTFSNPNNYAELLLLFVPFFVPLLMSLKKNGQRILAAAGAAVCVVALAMTYSRSCWVGIALAVVVFIMIYDKRFIVPAAIIAIAAIPFLPETIINRIFTIGSMDDSSNSYRIYIWEACIRMVRDFGLTGLGLGPSSFKAVYPDYAASIAATASHSHMLYMELVIETGVLGFASFMAYMFIVVKKTAGAMRRMTGKLRAAAAAGISSLGGIAFVCCVEYVWFYPRDMAAFWIVTALCLVTCRISKKEQQIATL
ncbi:MAG: O-antigen ligase family protein [Clostridia bacterium]|nr:O-antigen ligase family protein [Clostridia bacterium]